MKIILSDSILIEKAKLLVTGLGIPENTLLFSSGWLYGFKKCNKIQQIKLQSEAALANKVFIEETFPLLQNKYADYSSERIYNIDET
ncbi:9787_t:CDS:2, partial [Diversispora eburnea]